MMELMKLQSHTHELESILMGFKESAELPKAHISLFLRGIDAARSILDGEDVAFDFSVGETETSSVSEPVAPVQAAAEAHTEAHTEAAVSAAQAVEDIVSPASDVALDESLLVDFIPECDDILARVSERLKTIEENPSEAGLDLLGDLYREMHSLKGGAGLVGLKSMAEVAHAIESCLDPIRQGSHQMNKAFFDVLYKGVEIIELEIECLRGKMPRDQVEVMAGRIVKTLMLAAEQLPVRESAGQPEKSAEKSTEAPKTEPVKTAVAKSEPAKADAQTAKAAEKPADTTGSRAAESGEASAGASIRVPVSLLDSLMTLMGEMVLVRNQVIQYSNRTEDLSFQNLSQRLNVVTSEIQDQMMRTRMQPIGNVLSKFHRVARDLSQELGKDIHLTVIGAETELDKSLLEAIKDPLTHIVRNSCDHGIETIEARRAAGKPDTGHVTIRSFHEGGQVVVEISDDGKGLNREALLKKGIERGLISESDASKMPDRDIFNLIFAPGFSTAQQITNVSGRGVGMDVVRTNIEKVGGVVDLSSVLGKGTTIRLRIPLTLAIVPALIVRGGDETFAIPQLKLAELVCVDPTTGGQIEYIQGAPVYRLRGQLLPLIDLNSVLGRTGRRNPEASVNIVVLNADHYRFGLIVDSIDDTADIVVKPLNRLLKSLSVYSGATILGDGSIALILDVMGIAEQQKLTLGQSVRSNTEKEEVVEHRDVQEFLLFNLNSPTTHAILLQYVRRLEEFPVSTIEYSGRQRVVRYRGSILPIISLNQFFGLSEDMAKGSSVKRAEDVLSVIVTQRGDASYGIEVNEILDVLQTTVPMDSGLIDQTGIMGNLAMDNEVIVVVDPVHIAPKSLSATRKKGPNAGVRILYADDSPFFRKHVGTILTDAGHVVTVARDGREAVEILEKKGAGGFDVVLSDIEMPRMDGFELAKHLRQDSRWSEIPLVALTTQIDRKHVEIGQEAGFDVYLEKVKPDELSKTIDEVVGASGERVA
jgi:two-component system chemotaxis sensor kinase CheA